ncbi:MAG TPA: PQQ-binding-like beta-propeller repeat protein [Polyangiaceae bacterium]|nr:PQQ-binding-like beta-propeller repeat protein [Polyangiaceae bacterium]
MNPRARSLWAFCGLLWLSLAQPAAGAAPNSAPASAPLPRFRFDAGAPLAAPAEVAADGSVCVGTVDGYVHALAPDGSFRWSRSVRGAVTRRPHFAGERWFIVTSAQRVYALKRDGSLSWAFQLYSPVESELVSDAKGSLYFVAADHFLYGLSAHGQVTLRARFHPGMKPEIAFEQGEVLRDPEGNSWFARSDGVLEYRPASGEKSSLLPLANSALLPPAWSRASHFAVVSARSGLVFGLDPAHPRPSR